MGALNKERKLTPSWDLLAPSVELVKRNIWSVLYLSFLPSLFVSVGSTMASSGKLNFSDLSAHSIVGFSIAGVAGLWALLAFPGYLYMQVEASKGNTPAPLECFTKGLPRLLPLIAMFIIQGITVFVGFLLLIVPGLILVRSYFLSEYFLVDQKLGPLAALSASSKATKPVSYWIWGTIGVGIVISLMAASLSFIPFAGSIISGAIGYIYAFAAALRYNEVTNGINPMQFGRHNESSLDAS